MTNDIICYYGWDPSNSTLCKELTKHINEKMIEANVQFLFCKFSREAYTIDLNQRDKLKNRIEKLALRNDNIDVKYANTDDVMMTLQLSQKKFAEEAKILFAYFSELLIAVPRKSVGWDTFLNAFQHGHSANQIKKVRMLSHELILISTDEGLIQICGTK